MQRLFEILVEIFKLSGLFLTSPRTAAELKFVGILIITYSRF